MRALLAAVALLSLAACGQASAPADEAAASVPPPRVLMGHYRAASDTARNLTGNLAIERGGLLFERGVILYTRTLAPRRGSDLIARDGDSYAAVAVDQSDLRVELRRVTEEILSDGGRSLCGEDTAAYVAILHTDRVTEVKLLVFAGSEPPGPNATNSRLCGAYAYSAPDGARTRQGVVLW
jgi:hypothetical protein